MQEDTSVSEKGTEKLSFVIVSEFTEPREPSSESERGSISKFVAQKVPSTMQEDTSVSEESTENLSFVIVSEFTEPREPSLS
jgi:hypothetical protein